MTQNEEQMPLPDNTIPSVRNVEAARIFAFLSAGSIKEAVVYGRQALQKSSGNEETGDSAKLRIASAWALLAETAGGLFLDEQREEAKRLAESGLEWIRGRDSHYEARARLVLARVDLQLGNHQQSEEHLRQLQDRSGELEPTLRFELYDLKAALARECDDLVGEFEALKVIQPLMSDDEEVIRVSLRMAHLQQEMEGESALADNTVSVALMLPPTPKLCALLSELVGERQLKVSAKIREDYCRWAIQQGLPLAQRLDEQAFSALEETLQRLNILGHERDVDFQVLQDPRAGASAILPFSQHPAWLLLEKEMWLWASPARLQKNQAIRRFNPTLPSKDERDRKLHLLFNDPDSLLSRLTSSATDPARPGILAVRSLMLSILAYRGQRTVEEARVALIEALDSLLVLENQFFRVLMQALVLHPWRYNNVLDEDSLIGNIDLAQSESIDVPTMPQKPLFANPLELLAALPFIESACSEQTGETVIRQTVLLDRLHRFEEEERGLSSVECLKFREERLTAALATASSQTAKTQLTAALALVRTEMGKLQSVARGYPESALQTFDLVDVSALDEQERQSLEHYRAVCEKQLSYFEGKGVAFLRQRHDQLGPDASPDRLAEAKHNLADRLTASYDTTRQHFAEGFTLFEQALALCSPAQNPVLYSNTAYSEGIALACALRQHPEWFVGFVAEAVAEARRVLESTMEVAGKLDDLERQASAALYLCDLAMFETTPEDSAAALERPWRLACQYAVYLRFQDLPEWVAESEAMYATRYAYELARRFGAAARRPDIQGVAFLLEGANAETVARWIIRAQQPARRSSRARLERPAAVSPTLWDGWRRALAESDSRGQVISLKHIHEVAPDFLLDAPEEATWQWLADHAGSLAVAFIYNPERSLALLMNVDAQGRRQRRVVGLDLPPAPLNTPGATGWELMALMRKKSPGVDAGSAHDELAAWLREHAISPLRGLLTATPTVVLWCPDPFWRLLAPGALWGKTPVATLAALSLPAADKLPPRRASTLLVLADPGPSDARYNLRGYGERALARLSEAAQALSQVRKLGSVGARYGRTLLGEGALVRDTPASATDILAEAKEHAVIVLIAHGEAAKSEVDFSTRLDVLNGKLGAALLCVDQAGKIERLDEIRLAEHPESFAGATVLLLSCESGAMRFMRANPGGLAGRLLSAGARCVVAPLWPVRLDVAVEVGEAVLMGLAAKKEPWETLAGLRIVDQGDSPLLGREPPPAEEYRKEHELAQLAFVTWLG